MAEIITFHSKEEFSAQENLKGFIDVCKNQLTAFGAGLDFDSDEWDVTESLALKGHGNKRSRVIFSTHDSMKDACPQYFEEPFKSFAKSYLRYWHAMRPTKIIAFRLSALRALDAALSGAGGDSNPVFIDTHVCNCASQLIREHYEVATAYRIGMQLELIANFLFENRLTLNKAKWKSPIPRPVEGVRIGEEFDKKREDKLPSAAALDALPKIFHIAQDTGDVLCSAVAAILCSAPARINELLLLPENCEVEQTRGENESAYGLRWWPSKGANPMTKWVVTSMSSVVKDAISKIRTITFEARKIAKWYEMNPSQLYLSEYHEHLRSKEWLTMNEIAEIVGLADRAGGQFCEVHKIPTKLMSVRSKQVRFVDLEQAILRQLPEGFPFLNKEIGVKYSDALFVIRVNELHMQRSTYQCIIEPVSINQINEGLGAKVKHGFSSIFTKHGFTEPDGSAIKITTHQFRHYLNTLAQAGGMSQLDIAKWSGRKDVRQNEAYNHVTAGQMLQLIRDAVGDVTKAVGALAEIPKGNLIPRAEFAQLRIATAHTTELGYCVHDYTMLPCQKHGECIQCEDLVCIKGDLEKTNCLRQKLDEAQGLLEKAQEAMGKGYFGADRWVEHHKMVLDRQTQMLAILDDPNVAIGSVIQLAPTRQVARLNESGSRKRLPATVENYVPPIGLLKNADEAMDNL